MAKILFVNPTEQQCGVFQYGVNLSNILLRSKKHFVDCHYVTNKEYLIELVSNLQIDCIIYNWSSGIGGWQAEAPFEGLAKKQVAICHAGSWNWDKFDAVLFSDPTAQRSGNIFPIGRPVPVWRPEPYSQPAQRSIPWIGVNGFCGAEARHVAMRVWTDLPQAKIRLHLPFATYGDSIGEAAKSIADWCRRFCQERPSLECEICHDFLPMSDLIDWLNANDLNCYIRSDNSDFGNGVSSVLDVALAARRPIAINRFVGFRHLWNCTPSVCVEDLSLSQIMANSIAPLQPIYERNSPERVLADVEEALASIGLD